VKFACSVAVFVLKNNCQFVFLYDFPQEGLINVATLNRLAGVSSTEYVTCFFEPCFYYRNSWSVLKISKHQRHLHLKVMINVDLNKTVSE
jgi:hypothetical protein